MKKLFCSLLCLGLLVGCSSNEPKEKEYIDDSEISNVYSSPNDYKGKYLTVYGKVFGTVDESNGQIAFQMWQDPANSENNTVVYAASDLKDIVKEDAIVKVEGYVNGTFEGENAFGGTVTAPEIVADNIEKTDYATAFAPAIKSIDVNQSQASHNVTVTLDKVEIAKSQTRIYLTIDNQSGYSYNVYTFNTKILQESKQYEEETDYDADYEQLNTDLLNGAKTSGIITYSKIDETKDFKVIVEGQSDNYNWDTDEFTFEISVN